MQLLRAASSRQIARMVLVPREHRRILHGMLEVEIRRTARNFVCSKASSVPERSAVHGPDQSVRTDDDENEAKNEQVEE